MSNHSLTEVAQETSKARQMLAAECPKMFGFVAFFYATVGAGIPWRFGAAKVAIWHSATLSLLFGLSAGVAVLIVGGLIMKSYAQRKVATMGFAAATSLTMVTSFRACSIIGVPLALFDVFKIVIPASGPAGQVALNDWFLLLLLFTFTTGWFSGRAVGGLVGLLGIFLCGKAIEKRG